MIVHDGKHRHNGAWFFHSKLHCGCKTDRRICQTSLTDVRLVISTARRVLSPKSPKTPQRPSRLLHGFKVELNKSADARGGSGGEWDKHGRLWGCRDSRLPAWHRRWLENRGAVSAFLRRNNEGHFDHSTVFLDALPYPSGVMPWRDGVLVGAPDILFARDTSGDLGADRPNTLHRIRRRQPATSHERI